MNLDEDCRRKITSEFFEQNSDVLVVYPQDVGRSIENLIASERSKIATKAMDFVFDYLQKRENFKNE